MFSISSTKEQDCSRVYTKVGNVFILQMIVLAHCHFAIWLIRLFTVWQQPKPSKFLLINEHHFLHVLHREIFKEYNITQILSAFNCFDCHNYVILVTIAIWCYVNNCLIFSLTSSYSNFDLYTLRTSICYFSSTKYPVSSLSALLL